jgi:hypothetical protein
MRLEHGVTNFICRIPTLGGDDTEFTVIFFRCQHQIADVEIGPMIRPANACLNDEFGVYLLKRNRKCMGRVDQANSRFNEDHRVIAQNATGPFVVSNVLL